MRTLLIFALLFLSQISFAQERSYGMATANPSEIKASIIIAKVRETMTISDEQSISLAAIIANYWDKLEEWKGHKKYEEKLIKLTAMRDVEVLKILQDVLLQQEFQKQFDYVLAVQRRGYGRR